MHGLLAGDVVSRRGWRAAAVTCVAIAAGTGAAWAALTAFVVTALAILLLAAIGGCLTLCVAVLVQRGTLRDTERQVAELDAALRRVERRNRQLGADLSAARLEADTLRADVPDAATPELAAQIDGRTPERDAERLPCRRPAPVDRAGRYVPTAAEIAALADIEARLEAS